MFILSKLMTKFLFTSESVSAGHPDKMADQISDTILDAILTQDPLAHVACETYIKKGLVLIGGEISTTAWINIEETVRNTIKEIGYTDPSTGFDADSCLILNVINKQSPEIKNSIYHTNPFQQGAGDQGSMFGYATNETNVLMPAPITYAHRLIARKSKIRKNGKLPWLGLDAKSQITFIYEYHKIIGISSVVLSIQHDNSINLKNLKEAAIEEIIKPVLPKKWLLPYTKFFINPSGSFLLGGPMCDCGLTGRKIIVDTYGGMARHGGGSFSGKDPSKVDRSAAYAARYAAKNIVAAGLAERCEIQVSYAIGVDHPISFNIETFGTGKTSNENLLKLTKKFFDFRPYGLVTMLNLLRPIYRETSVYGHFGREIFSWEKTDKSKYLSDNKN